MRSILFLLAFVFITLPVSAEKLTVVADDWPPFSGPSLPNKGLSPHVISAVLTRAGYEVDVQILPWARIMNGARSGEFDIVGSLFYDEELTEFMSYSDSYYDTDIVFIQSVDSDINYSTLDALKPYSIAVGDGFLYEPTFDQADYLKKVVTTTTLQCIQMVAYGRANLTLDSIDVLKYTISNDVPDLENKIKYLKNPLTTQSIYMAIGKQVANHQTILKKFNQALNDMKNDGSYEKIIGLHTK